ncbi:MAG: DUF1036 domain-containing protein, partial [Fimbriimonadaceae bacterium]|nr:DUF1036 domain-containing protein [Alphaproteobacteria bacterium]
GWFRVYPGSCRSILSNTRAGERYFLHTRTPVIYDKMPEQPAISRMLCVREENFLLAGAESCHEDSDTLVAFSGVSPGEGNSVSTITLTEESEFSSAQARIAGFQRLLALAGHDPGPIDGSMSAKTELALGIVRNQNNLPPDTPDAKLFANLVSAALNAGGATGLTICNETRWQTLAAVAMPSGETIRSQGWFQLPANRCTKVLRIALKGDAIHIFAEAIDNNGRPVSIDGTLIRWQGEALYCTKSIRFDISDHTDCEARGLEATGFRSYPLDGTTGRVIWLREGE